MPISLKVKKADIVVENGGTLEELEKKIAAKVIPQIYQKLGYFDSNA